MVHATEEHPRKQPRRKAKVGGAKVRHRKPVRGGTYSSPGNPYAVDTPKHFAWELTAHVIQQADRAIARFRASAGIPVDGVQAAFCAGTLDYYRKLKACAKLIRQQIAYRTELADGRPPVDRNGDLID